MKYIVLTALLCIIGIACSKYDLSESEIGSETTIDLDVRSPFSMSFHLVSTSYSTYPSGVDTNDLAMVGRSIPVETEKDLSFSINQSGVVDLEIDNMAFDCSDTTWNNKSNRINKITYDGTNINSYDADDNLLIVAQDDESSGFSASELSTIFGSFSSVTVDSIVSNAQSLGATVKQDSGYTFITKDDANPNFDKSEALIFENSTDLLVLNSVFDDNDQPESSSIYTYDQSGNLSRISVTLYFYSGSTLVEKRHTLHEISNFNCTL